MKLSKLKDQFKKLFGKLKQFRYLIVGTVIVALFAYAVGVVNSELSAERDQAAYDNARQQVERVKFDQDAVKTIVKLRDLNIDVDAIFAPGRTNPFE
jgi:hypothetical protein